jgi:hypothetical protein
MRTTTLMTCVAALALLSAGCGSLTRASRHEPCIITVRNATGMRLAEVTVGPAGANNLSRRISSVSPVQTGMDQVFVRPHTHPPLPDQVEISWTDSHLSRLSQVISLRQILATSTGAPDEVLVIVIDARGASAVLEHTPAEQTAP